MRVPPVGRKTVLITGCSTGIGRATAFLLREHGWEVLPTARVDEDLRSLEEDGFRPIFLDLADSRSVDRAADETLARMNGAVGGVVNNAGFGQAGAVEDLSRDDLRRQFEVNVFGMQQLTNRFIPVFRGQRWGRIVNISSVYGRVTAPMVGAYCASKYAMESLSDAQRSELRGSGVAVSLVEPGPIVTDFRRNVREQVKRSLDLERSAFGDWYSRRYDASTTPARSGGLFSRPPEAVARKIRHALESRRPGIRYCVTIPAYFGAFMRRFAPTSLVDRILSANLRR
jgi:NAD(P)-dependent dehydrogenase (short-subunit alcohol dehydrogenase family)